MDPRPGLAIEIPTALARRPGLAAMLWVALPWYALTPPLALILITRALPRSSLAVVPAAIIGTLAWMLNLWFKGATAASYLGGHDVGDDGAARFR